MMITFKKLKINKIRKYKIKNKFNKKNFKLKK